MSSQPVVPGPIPVAEPENRPKREFKKKPKAKAKARPETAKPSKTLPNWRVSVAKQFDILRAYAAGSSKGTKPVSLEEASQIAGMAPTTTVAAHPFLIGLGFLKRTEAGALLPSADAIAYLSKYEWDQKTAAHKLGPRLQESWFGDALLPRLSYGQGLEEKAAINVLAEAAGASPEYEKELTMLLDFLAIGGVVAREGGLVKPVRLNTNETPAPPTERSVEAAADAESPVRSARLSSSYVAQASPGGGFDFTVSVHVDMAEFGTWKPDRISAFFQGIAQVLAAKADLEKGGAGS